MSPRGRQEPLDPSGKRGTATIPKIRAKAKSLQRLMQCYRTDIIEASWAPDDILNDKSRFHTC